jgi:hypothetical protein
MEHHDWDWPEGTGGDGDAETADLNDGEFDHADSFGDHLSMSANDSGPDESGGHEFVDAGPGGSIEEPLGTENATAHYDESLAHADDAVDTDHDPASPDELHAPGDVHEALDAGHSATDAGHDGDAGHVDTADPAHPDPDHPGTGPDVPDDARDGHVETLVGTDPDVDRSADHADWHDDSPFPPGLDINAPEPVDGFPWSDPAALGDATTPDDFTHVVGSDEGGAAHATGLARYDGVEVPPGTDAWTALLGSEDPATSALARWWAPDA